MPNRDFSAEQTEQRKHMRSCSLAHALPPSSCKPLHAMQTAAGQLHVCTVRLFAPGRSQQSAQGIWTSPVTAIRTVGCMGHNMASQCITVPLSHNAATTTHRHFLPSFSRAIQRTGVRTQTVPKHIVTSPIRIFYTAVIKISFWKQYYCFLGCDALQSGRSSPIFVCSLIRVVFFFLLWLLLEAVHFSETSVNFHRIARRHIPANSTLRSHPGKNLKISNAQRESSGVPLNAKISNTTFVQSHLSGSQAMRHYSIKMSFTWLSWQP
jgi:hypothetical protein